METRYGSNGRLELGDSPMILVGNRKVVWQGSAGDRRPYANQVRFGAQNPVRGSDRAAWGVNNLQHLSGSALRAESPTAPEPSEHPQLGVR